MRAVLVAILMIGGLAACREATKGPDLGEEAAPYVDAVSKRLEGRSLPPILTPDQERCVASSVVDGIGLDALRQAAVDPKTVSEQPLRNLATSVGTPERAAKIADGIVDCGVGGKFAGVFAGAELAGTPDDTELQKVIDCIGTEVTNDQAREIIAGYFFHRPTDEVQHKVRTMLEDCGFKTR